jgi:hypothetical protein
MIISLLHTFWFIFLTLPEFKYDSLRCFFFLKKRLQSFVEEGEREMMHQQIIVLQDKVCN